MQIGKILTDLSLMWKDGTLYRGDGESIVPVANFLPIVKRCAQDCYTGAYMLDLEIWVANQKTSVNKAHVPFELIQQGDWVQALGAICYVQSHRSRIVRQFVQAQMAEIPPTIIRKSGWNREGETWSYVFDGMETRKNLEPNNDETGDSHTIVIEILQKVKKMLKTGGPCVYISFLIMLYAVLRSIFEEAGITHPLTLYLVGPSQTFKTSLARYFAVWTDTSPLPVFSLEGRHEDLKKGIQRFSDCLVLLDDLAPMEQTSANRIRNDQIAGLIRDSFNDLNDRPDTKAQQNASNVKMPTLVLTAEQFISIDSVLNRTCLLSTVRTPIPESFLNFQKAHPRLIKEFVPLFISWVVEQRDVLRKYMQKRWEELRLDMDRTEIKHPRVADSYVILRIVQEIFIRLYTDYVEDENEKKFFKKLEKYWRRAYQENLDILEEEQEQKRGRSLDYKVLRTICQWIKEKKLELHGRCVSPIYHDGFIDRHYIYLCVNPLWNRLVQQEGMEKLTVCKLSKILLENQLISAGKGKDLQVKKVGERCYRIDRKELEELTQTLLHG